MAQVTEETKAFNMRLPTDMWKFLKHISVDQERSMTEIIIWCINRYKKKFDKTEKDLTDSDTSV